MVLYADSAVRSEDRTKVKILIGPTMRCDAPSCDQKAGYLFRAGKGPISAYCDYHAREEAATLGAKLPDTAEKVLRMGSAGV